MAPASPKTLTRDRNHRPSTPAAAGGRSALRRRLAAAARAAAALALAATTIQLLQACSFGAPDSLKTPAGVYGVLDSAPYADDATVTEERWRVIDAAKLKVDHGTACARAPRAATKEYIGMRIYGSATLPANFSGTVFLNGWYLEYEKNDHHVGGLGSAIFNIAQTGNELHWDAGGVLTDKNGDDAYSWCYRYTIVAWARDRTRPGQAPGERVDMGAIHADASGRLVYVDSKLGGRRLRTNLKLKMPGVTPAAKLLTGFGVGFKDDDHHLLQFGFDLGKSRIKNKKLKWTTDVVLQDNSRRDYYAAQVATLLTGESVHVWKPDAVLLEEGHPNAPGFIDNDLRLAPYASSNVCLGGPSSHTYSFKITGVPFTWGIPMLTGWRVGQNCDDEHVKKMGAWIDDFAWVRNPGDSQGTLYYTVRTILEDKKPTGVESLFDGMQVEVLGINLLEPPGNAPASLTTPADAGLEAASDLGADLAADDPADVADAESGS
jgi:hypothetical protein